MKKERIEILHHLESLIDCTFEDLHLLDTALTHRSYINEIRDPGLSDNERLEFLGDSVLSLSISELLIHQYHDMNEGELSKMRASVVNEQWLAKVAADMGLGNYLLLGRGEEASGGKVKTSILADTFEAVIGALFLDGGYEKAFSIIKKYFEPSLVEGIFESVSEDYKSRLQEFCQKEFKDVPIYEDIGNHGPDHDKIFEVAVSVCDIIRSRGIGKSKKSAEQDGARKALEILTDTVSTKQD